MIKAIYDLDMTPRRTLPIIINVSQYDDIGRTLVFNLFSSSGKWTAPTSAAVTFEGGKPDGKFFAYNCAYSNGTVTVTIQQQMTAVAGKVRCKIKVTSGDKVVESAPIIMIVDAAAVPDGSDMSKSDINDAIANATQKIVDQVKDNIPSDYSQLSTDVSSLKQDLGEVVSKFEDKLVNIEFNYSIGVYDKAHKLNTGVGINAEIPVKAGQNYVISCHNYNANVPCYLVFNENYTLIESYGNDVTNEDKHLAITIPLGGSRLIINSYDINKTYVLKKQLVSVSEFVDSENQYVDVTPQIMNGYIDYKKDVYQSAGCHVLFNVTEGEKYKVDGLNFSEGYPLGFCYRKDGANMQTLTGFGNQTRVHGYEFTVPNGAVEVAINSDDIKCLRVYKYKKPSTEEIARKNIGIKNKGKKIVWFGTSIPAGCYNPSDLHTSYPMIIGDRLGITVYNEAVPSSPVHGMRKSQITESNPYGFFAESFSAACLALACTLEEKEWLISHWNDSFWTGGKYTSMTETQAEYIRNTSYEKKLDKYLNADNFPDAFVFDVGRNDIWGDEDATYTGYDRYTFPNAMHFLIDRIYRYRKDAKIIIIGHYSNQERSKNDTVVDFPQKVAKCQSDISDMWMLPICKTWEKTGWTNQSVYSSGSSKSMLAWNLPDQLHPHSDTSGKATRHMADIICPFIRDNI